MFPTPSPRQKAGLAVALATLLWIPLGVSHGDHTMITGHSTFYNGETYDPCLGSIAGIMRNRVMWFNDQVLVESYGGKGTFIYVTEAGAENPTQKGRLSSAGVFYDFVDPNGAHWHVEELFYSKIKQQAVIDPNDNSVHPNAVVEQLTVEEERTYVWTVELAARPIYDDFAGASAHTYYNFLVLADTCKMHNGTATYDGEEVHATADVLNDDNGHPNGEDPHKHGRFMVDLWVGKRPIVQPWGVPATDGGEWETQWAQGEGNKAAPADEEAPADWADRSMPPEDSLP